MKDTRKRPQQRGLSESRNTFEQNVTACEETNEYSIDNLLLPNYDFSDFIPNAVELGSGEMESAVGLHNLY